MRIGFLFNHEGAHQVAHGLPVARALTALRPEAEVTVFVAAGAAEDEARRLAPELSAAGRIVRLRDAGPLPRAMNRLSGGSIPADRVDRLRLNRALLAPLDAIVVPEKTSLLLRSHFDVTGPAFIHTRHGAGDRAVGFDRASAGFDLVLLSGPKIRDRLAEAGLLRPGGHAMVGYPKFDLIADAQPVPPFDNGRPTVLYNPHPAPGLSSWYGMGRAVLDYFAAGDRFNLLFAPHIMLFAKRFNIALSPPSLGRVGPVPRRYDRLPHMRIDPGSRASVDMSYTLACDIYLGDASSQVYEFLARPRPCIFLNPRRIDWEGDPNFAHWRAGPVVEDIAGLDAALAAAMTVPDAYRDVQDEIFRYSFDLDGRPSAERAAAAIAAFVGARVG